MGTIGSLFVVAFLREQAREGYRVVVVHGRSFAGRSVVAEVKQGGLFAPIHDLRLLMPTIRVRTPPVFLMRGWIA